MCIRDRACKDAIIHCLSKTFEVNEWSKLYNANRTLFRENKLTTRGWDDLNGTIYSKSEEINRLKKQRISKIYTLEFQPEYDYKVWTEDEYLNRPKKEEKDFWK